MTRKPRRGELSGGGSSAAGPRSRRLPRHQVGLVVPLGRVWVEIDHNDAIQRVCLVDMDVRKPSVPTACEPLSRAIEKAFVRYGRGDGRAFDGLVLARARTPFAAAVRRVLRAIPYGTVMTYGEVAGRLGRPRAARAVGQACAANPIPVVVPCHRVVSAGAAGGFGLGLAAKEKLLRWEATGGKNLRPSVRKR